MDDFETQLTSGHAHWIAYFEHDETAKTISIALQRDLNDLNTRRLLRFANVVDFSVEWMSREPDVIEGLIGATETPDGTRCRYRLATEQREIVFGASKYDERTPSDQLKF
jgi:hypothetical protein